MIIFPAKRFDQALQAVTGQQLRRARRLRTGRHEIDVGNRRTLQQVFPLIVASQIVAESVRIGEAKVRVHRRTTHIAVDQNDLVRSEEHTSELQSLMRISYAVFCLKKKNKKK